MIKFRDILLFAFLVFPCFLGAKTVSATNADIRIVSAIMENYEFFSDFQIMRKYRILVDLERFLESSAAVKNFQTGTNREKTNGKKMPQTVKKKAAL